MMFDWEYFKIKLTSRKLWISIASFVTLILTAIGKTESEIAQVTAIIMAGAVVVGYLIANGLEDR